MKVIFLDFDGPIIPRMSHLHLEPGEREKAWPPCIKQLNRITDQTGAVIVVSSTWRWGGEDHVRGLLQQWGATGQVIGITPTLDKRGQRVWYAPQRGDEIGAWLWEHKEVDAFVILDDDDDMGRLKSRLVQTPMETGITERLADFAILILKRGDHLFHEYT